MSIVTKTGDTGTTGLMYNRRVPKNDSRVEACGCVDELNAALGIAKASISKERIRETITAIQRDLVILMGELATVTTDRPRFLNDGFKPVGVDMIERLDAQIVEIEAEKISPEGWAMPGATGSSACLDFARTVCRRAERRVCDLQINGDLPNPRILVYLNRLADLLWLLARQVEATKVP